MNYKLVLLFCLLGSALSSSCKSCSTKMSAKIDQAKLHFTQKITSKLGFDVTRNYSLPEETWAAAREISRQLESRLARDDAVIEESLTIIGHQLDAAVRFDVNDETGGKRIVRAELLVHLARPESAHARKHVTMKVYAAEDDETKGALLATRRVMSPLSESAQHIIHLSGDVIERLDLAKSVALIVEALYDDDEDLVQPADGERKMLLTLVLAESKRVKRAINWCPKGEENPSCCVQSIYINFRQLGWPHVIAPDSFDLLACMGSCESNTPRELTRVEDGDEFNSRTMMATANLERYSCCFPTEYVGQNFMFVSPSGNFRERFVTDVGAVSCSCS